jgi:hypothetical protein
MSRINDRPPPRPSRPAITVADKAELENMLRGVAARLGCIAIEARAMWDEGDSTVIFEAEAGAAEGDVQRLKKQPWKLRTP